MPQESKIYTCFSFSPILLIRIFVFGFMILFFFLWLADFKAGTAVWISISIIFLISAIYVLSTYTRIVREKDSIYISAFHRNYSLSNISDFETWWTYDIGISSPEIVESRLGKSNPTANKINSFIEFNAEAGQVYLCEQIFLGQKFPNNHPYLPDRKIDHTKLFKVWDIDRCLTQLGYEKKP